MIESHPNPIFEDFSTYSSPTPTLVYSTNRIIFPILVAENSCHMPPDPGPCEAFMPSWFFNNTARSCAVFIYGGCNGNKNRFPSYYDCQDSCNGKSYRQLKETILIITLTLQERQRTIGLFIRGKTRRVLHKTRNVPFIRACLI